MTSTTFKQLNNESAKTEILPKGKDQPNQPVVEVEPPFLDYHSQKGKPLSVEYFELGDTWKLSDGFEKEITDIEEYFKEEVESGEIANSPKAVKNELKKIEKLLGLKDEERTVMRVGKVAAYIRFLLETKGLEMNVKRYGSK